MPPSISQLSAFAVLVVVGLTICIFGRTGYIRSATRLLDKY